LNGGEGSVDLSLHGFVFSRRGLGCSSGCGGGSSTSLESLVFLPQSVDSIDHLLYKLNLGVSESVLVGNVISVSSLSAGFSTGSTGLKVELFAAPLKGVKTDFGPSGKVNVDRGSHTSTKIGGAGVDITVLPVHHEILARLLLDRLLDSLDTSGEAIEDTLNVSSLLHGDDAKLILLVHPGEEGLCRVVEDATALGPVTFHTSDLEVSVTRHEEEVIVDQLLSDFLVHTGKRIVCSLKVSLEVGKGLLHERLDALTLFLGNSRGKSKSINGTSDSDTARMNWNIAGNVTLDLGAVHVRSVSGRREDSMVLLDDGVKNNGKVLVRVPVTSVDTAVLVVEFNGDSDGFVESES